MHRTPLHRKLLATAAALTAASAVAAPTASATIDGSLPGVTDSFLPGVTDFPRAAVEPETGGAVARTADSGLGVRDAALVVGGAAITVGLVASLAIAVGPGRGPVRVEPPTGQPC